MVVNSYWQYLKTPEGLEDLEKESHQQAIIFLKHSTRCPISGMVFSNMIREWDVGPVQNSKFYVVDILNHRDISNELAERYQVEHQSPQVLVISKGKCVYHDSHMNISFENIRNEIENLK